MDLMGKPIRYFHQRKEGRKREREREREGFYRDFKEYCKI